ncbi:MAG TPA: BrnT family toxin [Terriglobia bacterium]|nr:BrnT family toxin [Terriglobia bacterium]
MSIMGGEPPWEFDWDAANVRHLAKHRITRSEFEQTMLDDPIVIDFTDETGEERWYALGATERLRVLFLVFTYREERIRPITGWDADKKLRELYFRKKGE